MKKILFVCTGNTCRSPMAKALFEKLLAQNGIDNIIVDSAGISAGTENFATDKAIQALREENIDLSFHRSKRITESLLKENDLIIVLSEGHKIILVQFFPEFKEKIMLLGGGIADPYFGDIDDYRRCRDEIKNALYKILYDIKSKQDDITIELMKKEHIDQISEIENECFSSPWTKEQFLEILEKDFTYFAVALNKNEVVGYIGLYCILDEGQITNVAVKNSFRRQGVAKKLIEYIKNEAMKRGIKILTLEVRASNIPAINLYKKLGFSEIGRRANFYENPREDAILMIAVI